MEKEVRTKTYGEIPLKITTGQGIFPKGIEVKARVDLETGEVHFYVDSAALEKLK